MKLRIKGDSLRFRITPSEMQRLVDAGRIDETVHFAAEAKLTYALEQGNAAELTLRYTPGEVAVVLPAAQARRWAQSDEVGIYGTADLPTGIVELTVEKDWACLDKNDKSDKSDPRDEDAFPNPNEGVTC